MPKPSSVLTPLAFSWKAVGRKPRGKAERDGRMSTREGQGASAICGTSSIFQRFRRLTCGSILDAAMRIKAVRRKGESSPVQPLAGKVLAMIFDKPSTRTRVSFDLAMRELGGETMMLTGKEMQLGRGETIADTARVLSRFVDAIVIRMLDHDDHARTRPPRRRAGHQWPDQAVASLPGDGRRPDFRGASRVRSRARTVAWSGDANNVLASWIHAAQRFDFSLACRDPDGAAICTPDSSIGRAVRAPGWSSSAIPMRRSRAPTRSSRIAGSRWATWTRPSGTNLLAPYQVNAQAHGLREQGRDLHALPAGPSRRGSDR